MSGASSASGPSSDLVGRQIGNYRIDTLIGSGGMGKVYRAVHAHLGRPAAVKVIHDHLASDPGFKARFEREANASASLNHPHIIKILDFGDQEGRAYLVMELATGGSLRTLLQRHASSGQPLAWQIGVPLVVQAAEGLEYANARNTVHRDVKPDNLMLQGPDGPDGPASRSEPLPNPAADPLAYTVKICDFGLAQLRHDGRMTATGTTVGTPAYISPEQCQGLQVDGRSDLYSLGIVLYEVATGYLPFETKSLAEALYKHVNTPPPPPRGVRPDLPADLEAIILRCLAKRPEERYEDCGQLAAALREAMARVTPMPGAAPSAERLLAAGSAAGSALVATEIPSDGPPGGPVRGRIFVLDDKGQIQQAFDLPAGGLTVGRGSGCEVSLDDDKVSRRHLRVDWDGQRATVTDLGSGNGTWLGGARLPPNVPRPWPPGAPLRVGPFGLRLDLAGAAPAAAPAVAPAVALGAVASAPRSDSRSTAPAPADSASRPRARRSRAPRRGTAP